MILALLGTSASGEPPPKKMISLTEVVPVLTSVSDYTGDVWSRSTMFGDVGGVRQDLYEKGFMLDVAMTQVVQGIVSGADVGQDWGYNGVLEHQAAFDTGSSDDLPTGGSCDSDYSCSFARSWRLPFAGLYAGVGAA